MARGRRKSISQPTAPTGKIPLTPEQIEKAKAALPGIGRRRRAAEAEIVQIMRSARGNAKETKQRLADLTAEQNELEDMILDGYRKVDAQQDLFDSDDPPS